MFGTPRLTVGRRAGLASASFALAIALSGIVTVMASCRRAARDLPALHPFVGEDHHISDALVCGPDPDEHIQAIQEIVDAGFDEVHVGQIGPNHDGFVDFYAREILPHFATTAARIT
jgi:hypothetical protein